MMTSWWFSCRALITLLVCSWFVLFLQSLTNRHEKNTVAGDKTTTMEKVSGAGPRSDRLITSESTFSVRKRRVGEVCRNYPEVHDGGVLGVFTNKRSRIIYCFVPKAGCTFWKRVFNVANEPYPRQESILDIPRYHIHTLAGNGADFDPKKHDSSQFPVRFTIARDPFSRLLSAYLDKAYLPDFWSQEMLPFVRAQSYHTSSRRDFLRMHFIKMAAKFGSTGSPIKDRICGKYVTFAEFVHASYDNAEPHWMPISQICNPCKFNVTHLSYMESFTQDARAILHQLGFDSMLDDMDRDKQVEDELRMITTYNFYIFNTTPHIRLCSTPHEIAYRLWWNFRWRGYIDPDVNYVVPKVFRVKDIQDDLMRQLAQARQSGLRHREKMSKAKRDFYKQAYMTLDPSIFEKLVYKYRHDFKLYGFEESRDRLAKLFRKRKRRA